MKKVKNTHVLLETGVCDFSHCLSKSLNTVKCFIGSRFTVCDVIFFRWQQWVKTRTNKNPKYHQATFPATILTRVTDIYPGNTLFYCLAGATAPLMVTHNHLTVPQSQGGAGFECHRPSAGQSGWCYTTEVLFCVPRICVCLFWCCMLVRQSLMC